jgi:hypothetical protein
VRLQELKQGHQQGLQQGQGENEAAAAVKTGPCTPNILAVNMMRSTASGGRTTEHPHVTAGFQTNSGGALRGNQVMHHAARVQASLQALVGAAMLVS